MDLGLEVCVDASLFWGTWLSFHDVLGVVKREKSW